jgi:hypothetical protein
MVWLVVNAIVGSAFVIRTRERESSFWHILHTHPKFGTRNLEWQSLYMSASCMRQPLIQNPTIEIGYEVESAHNKATHFWQAYMLTLTYVQYVTMLVIKNTHY